MLNENEENRNCGCGFNNMNNQQMNGYGYNNMNNCGCNNQNNFENYNNMVNNMNNANTDNYNTMTAAYGNISDNYLANNTQDNGSCGCAQYNQTRDDMIERIKCLNFAITELGLYLDTHVDDEKAICLHRKYCKEYRELTDKYQKVYGPLTIQFPCNKWRWIEEPWPWERGNF